MTERDEMIALAERFDSTAKRSDIIAGIGHEFRADAVKAHEDRLIAKALRLAAGAGWKPIVRPLEWVTGVATTTDDDNGPLEGVPHKLQSWSADVYTIIRQKGPHGRFILTGKSDEIGLVVYDITLAQAAAQADYEARIRSALALPPPPLEGG